MGLLADLRSNMQDYLKTLHASGRIQTLSIKIKKEERWIEDNYSVYCTCGMTLVEKPADPSFSNWAQQCPTTVHHRQSVESTGYLHVIGNLIFTLVSSLLKLHSSVSGSVLPFNLISGRLIGLLRKS